MSLCKITCYVLLYFTIWILSGSPDTDCLFVQLCYYIGLSCLSWWSATLIYNKLLSSKIPRISPIQRAVFVTGCDYGFGLMTAINLSEKGFHVFAGVFDESAPGGERLKKSSSEHQRITVVRCDVTDVSSILDCVQQVESFLEQKDYYLHAVVNNAGINLPNMIEFHKPSSVTDFERMFNVNLFGIIRICRLVLPLLRRSMGSRIINIASQAGRSIAYGSSSYCVTKAAVIKLTEDLNTEISQFGIKCISVEPFFFKTQLCNLPKLTQHMSNSWEETFSDTRAAYGGKKKLTDLINTVKFSSSNERFTNPNIGEAVDMIVDAVTSVDPEFVYSRVPIVPKLYLWMMNVLPYDIQFYLNQHQEPFHRFIMNSFQLLDKWFGNGDQKSSN